ncbi:hypothetical protein Tco_0191183 [Tanacetum coccineum]
MRRTIGGGIGGLEDGRDHEWNKCRSGGCGRGGKGGEAGLYGTGGGKQKGERGGRWGNQGTRKGGEEGGGKEDVDEGEGWGRNYKGRIRRMGGKGGLGEEEGSVPGFGEGDGEGGDRRHLWGRGE